MPIFYLIRHGETEWNVTRRVMGRNDIPLNSRGEKQVELMARFMREFSLDGVFSSPQLRARQTAAPVAANSDLPVQIAPELAEVDFPLWLGKSWEELQSDDVYRQYHESPATARHEGFEAIPDVQTRACALIDRLSKENAEGRYVLVSHADPLRVLINDFLKQPLTEFRRFRVSNASVTVIKGSPAKWVMTLFNYRDASEIVRGE